MERLEAETSGNAGRLTGLDGLRGIAACIVAFGFHAQILFPRDSLIGTGPISDWLLVNGWTAVDLFFVLSGFVFAHVYLSKELLAGPGALKDFAIARLARLYPLHIVTLCLALAMFPAAQDNTGSAFLFHVLMLQALAEPVRHTFNGPAWSVSVEMFCYAAFVAGWAHAMRGEWEAAVESCERSRKLSPDRRFNVARPLSARSSRPASRPRSV